MASLSRRSVSLSMCVFSVRFCTSYRIRNVHCVDEIDFARWMSRGVSSTVVSIRIRRPAARNFSIELCLKTGKIW